MTCGALRQITSSGSFVAFTGARPAISSPFRTSTAIDKSLWTGCVLDTLGALPKESSRPAAAHSVTFFKKYGCIKVQYRLRIYSTRHLREDIQNKSRWVSKFARSVSPKGITLVGDSTLLENMGQLWSVGICWHCLAKHFETVESTNQHSPEGPCSSQSLLTSHAWPGSDWDDLAIQWVAQYLESRGSGIFHPLTDWLPGVADSTNAVWCFGVLFPCRSAKKKHIITTAVCPRCL